MIEDVTIIGSGPAGLTAALYSARAGRSPLVMGGPKWGGLLQETSEVENFPAFPEGLLGPEIMHRIRAQAERFGARVTEDWATSISVQKDGGLHVVHADGNVIETKTLILALGAEHRKLGVPGEEELAGRGVSYCATCDGAFFRRKRVLVVGGGDSAMEEALALSRLASHVTLANRSDTFRASDIMLKRVRATENIEVLTNTIVTEVLADDAGRKVAGVHLVARDTAVTSRLAVDGVFIAIGHMPRSDLLEGQFELDAEGYLSPEGTSMATSVPGVFVAGDVVDRVYRQAVTAAGSGCKAALDAERYLQKLKEV